jgi:streptogramin lyase
LPSIDNFNNPVAFLTASGTPYLVAFPTDGSGLYTANLSGNITTPYASAVDSNGNMWGTSFNPASPGSTAANALDIKFTVASGISGQICTASNYQGGSGVAIDHANNAWISDYVTGYVLKFGPGCASVGNYNVGGLAGTQPVGIAMDGASNAWTLTSAGTLIGLSNAGAAISGAAGYATGTTGSLLGPVMDGSGDAWFTNATTNTVSEVIGVGTPVVTPISTAVVGNTLGYTP